MTKVIFYPRFSNLLYKIWQQIRSFALIILAALIFKSFVFDSFRIPSSSMLPTLEVGDFVIVSKLSYGYSRHSLPLSLPLIPGRLLFSEPKRGDVVVFRKPNQTGIFYIKRVVGLPGDRLQVVDGVLTINDQPVIREPIENYRFPRSIQSAAQYQERFTAMSTRPHRIIEASGDTGLLDNTRVYRVPANSYFMMGDNRDSSQDSRFQNDIGYVHQDYLIGLSILVLLSVDLKRPVWEWIRFDRFFKSIQ